MFQSTHPRGVRLLAEMTHFPAIAAVSIHAPAWGATRFQCYGGKRHQVSIHAPAWGATRTPLLLSRLRISFNPRTRVGCDHEFFDNFIGIFRFQSTHPRGVRQMSRDARLVCHAFQSTHPRGVRRPCRAADAADRGCFNPRTRVGCDLEKPAYISLSWEVSIHAPAWGATRRLAAYPAQTTCFNPRTRVGCDTVYSRPHAM